MSDPDSETTVSGEFDYDVVELGIDGVNFVESYETAQPGWHSLEVDRKVRWRVVQTLDGLFHWHWTMLQQGDVEWTRGEDTYCGRDHFVNNQRYTINQINCLECACR